MYFWKPYSKAHELNYSTLTTQKMYGLQPSWIIQATNSSAAAAAAAVGGKENLRGVI